MKTISHSLLLIGALWLQSCNSRHDIEHRNGQAPPVIANESLQGSIKPAEEGLSLRLDLPSEKTPLNKSILAVLVIENHDDFYWAFFPAYAPKNHTPEDYPVAELEFLIRNEAGSYLEWVGNYEGLREPPPLCSALILMPHSFIGYRIPLTEGEFSYRLTDPGTYRVRARLRLDQKSWAQKEIRRQQHGPAQVFYDIRRVFEGVLESNEVTVTIPPKNSR